MNLSRRKFALASAALGPWFTNTHASTYPSKPLRIIVPYAAGGSTDVFARHLGLELGARMGQSVIVENRTGGMTVPAVQTLTQAPADGHTFAIFESVTVAVNQFLYKRPPYDPESLQPAAKLFESALGIVVHPDFPARTLKEFVSRVNEKPGTAYGSAGTGSVLHLIMEAFLERAGVKSMTHVPYRGGLPAIQDLMAGQVPAVMIDLPTIVQHVQAGKVRLLAVTSESRVKQFPDTLTFSEAGYPGFSGGTWFAAYLPPGTPSTIVQQLSTHLRAALESPRISGWLGEVAMNAAYLPPAQTKAESQTLVGKYQKIIKQLDIPPQ